MPDDISPPVTTVLGASGACPEINLDGKIWRVGHPTQRAKAVLEQLAVAAAVGEVMALKGTLPPDAYAELWRQLTDDIAAKHYRTWGQGWQRVVWGPLSAHLFLLSLLRENHPAATEEDARRLAAGNPEGVAAALAQVTPNFVCLLLDDRTEIPHQQREEVKGIVLAQLAKALPTPPAPTPATTATPSASGARRSARNPGVSRPKPSPA